MVKFKFMYWKSRKFKIQIVFPTNDVSDSYPSIDNFSGL